MADKPWSGVFTEGTDEAVERFTESVSYDRRLFEHDINGSIAHAEMLAAVELISAEECRQIVGALEEIRREIREGRFHFKTSLEDIHMNIESALIERLGDIGRKLHTARSRNDQVSTDFRMWIREQIDALCLQISALQDAFVSRCDVDADIILPGYTHTQRAQPVLAAHYWLAYCEKLERDRERLIDCRGRANHLPLGTAALAGTSLPIDRDLVLERLHFNGVVANSLDASSDRDYALEFAFCLSLIATHLSGWAEEWIWWTTSEFGFLKLPQAFCTGSSIMPHKINPDVLELIRGKTGRVVGNLQSLFVLTKGLPLAYNRDLQEDKERVFDSADTVESCLQLAAPIVAGAEIQRNRVAAGLEQGYLDATTLMEFLIKHDIPQRTAHRLIGKLVSLAMQEGKSLAELSPEQLSAAHPSLQHAQTVLGAQNAIQQMQSMGSTGPGHVAQQISQWKERLKERSSTTA